MKSYEIPIPVIKDLALANGTTGTAKQIQIGFMIFVYVDVLLTQQLPVWTGIITGLDVVDIQEYNININGTLIQIKPSRGFIQTAQQINANTRIVANIFYVI